MNFEEALKIELESISGLSGKVFPIVSQEGTASPYLTYNKTGYEKYKTLGRVESLVDASYRLDIFHTKFTSLKTLSDLVITKLKTFEFRSIATTGPYIQMCIIDDEVPNFDQETQEYQSTIEIKISYWEV